MVTALATVPGATGAQPIPPTVAMASARRVENVSERLGAIRDELVAFHLGDTRARETPGCETIATAQIHDAVDLRRLSRRPAFPRECGILARPVHQHVDDGADELGVAIERRGVVLVLHRGGALGSGFRIDLAGEGRRRRALLGRIREHAQAIEARVVEEREQIFEGGSRLSGEADEHRRPQGDVGDRVAKLPDDLQHATRRHRATHGAQHAVVAVLHRHVHVRHDARARELVEHAVVDVSGMQVHRPDPRHPRVFAERQQQVADVAVADEIAAVRERVLGDQDGLLDSALGEPIHLRNDVAQWPAPMLAAKLRDRAEGAAHVAAFGDLHVRVRNFPREQPRRGRVVQITRRGGRRPVFTVRRLAHEIDDALEPRGAEDRIDLGHLLQDLAAVALRQAAGDDQRAAAAAPLQLGELEDGVDRLLARAVDEGARVHDHAFGVLGALYERMAGGGEAAEHQLGVDLVLGTTERGQVDLHRASDRAAIVEGERDAEVLLADELHHRLQIVAALAGHTHLILVDRGLHSDLAVLHQAHDLFGLLHGNALLQPDLLPARAARRGLDVAVGESLQRDTALVKLALQDIRDCLELHVIGRKQDDVGLVEGDLVLRPLEVVTRLDLTARLIERVGDLLHVDLAHDVERVLGSHGDIDYHRGGPPMSIRRVVPNVRARHGVDSRAFYVDVLGLELVMDMDFVKTFASPSNPTAQISVVHADPARAHPDLTVEVADVDAAYARARERGVEILYPLTDEPWGVRRFYAREPNGAVVNVMTRRPVETTAARAS